MVDDALFWQDGSIGADGTQPPPPPLAFSDPLGGLVTGFLFTDTTVAAPDETHFRQEAVPTAPVTARRARPAALKRSGTPMPTGSVTPAQFGVAAPLPARPVRQPTPTVPRTNAVAPAPSARANRRQTIGTPARVEPARAPKRAAGAGCAIFLVVLVAVVAVFVILGIVLGHGDGGVTSGGGG